MNVVSITGICGGVGATTATAQLAAALAMRGRYVVAFDFSPHNTLRLHFGMPWEDGNGLVSQVMSGKPWNEAGYRCENGVDFLPFGQCGWQESEDFYRMLHQDSAWLASRLGELDNSADPCVLIDCPRTGYALRSQVYALSDLIVVVLAADTMSYAAIPEFRACLAPGDAAKVVYLLNGFDPTRALDRDIAKLLRFDLKTCFCPVTIHRDESVREALASKLSVDAYAPYSQASGDFAALTTWLAARLTHLEVVPHVEPVSA